MILAFIRMISRCLRNRRTGIRSEFLIRRAFGVYKQPVAVDAVWRAGHQRQQILTLNDLQFARVVRLYHVRIGDGIFERPIQNTNVDLIAVFQLVEVIKELLRRVAAVGRDAGMGAFTTDWERGVLQVTRSLWQDTVGLAVVNGKLDVYRRDLKIAHYPVIDVQNVIVLTQYARIRFLGDVLCQGSVIPLRLCKAALDLRVRQCRISLVTPDFTSVAMLSKSGT